MHFLSKSRKAAENLQLMSILSYEKSQRNFHGLQKRTGGGPPPTPPTPPHPDSFSIPNSKYDLLPMSFSSQVSFPDPPVLSIPDPVLSIPDPPVLSISDPVLGLKQPVKDILSSVCDEVFENSYCFTPVPTNTHTPASSTASKFSYTPALVPPHASRPAPASAPVPPYAHVPAPASAPATETAPAPATETAPAPATNRTSLSSKTSKSSKSSSPDPLVAEGLVTMKRKAEIIGKLYSCYINYPQMLYIKLILNFI